MPSPITQVVIITKENHTYDTIFDHVPGANDDPSLLRWGYHQKIAAAGQPDEAVAEILALKKKKDHEDDNDGGCSKR